MAKMNSSCVMQIAKLVDFESEVLRSVTPRKEIMHSPRSFPPLVELWAFRIKARARSMYRCEESDIEEETERWILSPPSILPRPSPFDLAGRGVSSKPSNALTCIAF